MVAEGELALEYLRDSFQEEFLEPVCYALKDVRGRLRSSDRICSVCEYSLSPSYSTYVVEYL